MDWKDDKRNGLGKLSWSDKIIEYYWKNDFNDTEKEKYDYILIPITLCLKNKIFFFN
jgi:hypothetical protein